MRKAKATHLAWLGLAWMAACTQPDDPRYFFTPANPEPVWLLYDSLSLVLEYPNGFPIDSLFHGPLTSFSQLHRLAAPNYRQRISAQLQLQGWVAGRNVFRRLEKLAGDSIYEIQVLREPQAGLSLVLESTVTEVTENSPVNLTLRLRQAPGGVVSQVLLALGEGGEWALLPGGPFDDTAFTLTKVLNFKETGRIEVRAQARVGKVFQVMTSRDFTVGPDSQAQVNSPPLISASDTFFVVGVADSITLGAEAVDSDGFLKSFAWDLDGDAVYEREGTLNSAKATLITRAAASRSGDNRVILKVVDDDGDADLKVFTLRAP